MLFLNKFSVNQNGVAWRAGRLKSSGDATDAIFGRQLFLLLGDDFGER